MARTAAALEALLFVVVAVVPAAAQVDQALAEQMRADGDRGRRHWNDRDKPAGAGG